MRIDRSQAIEAWHFLPTNRRTKYSDELVTVGSVLTVNPPIECCRNGLHASVRATDALKYAPGPISCRVRVWGEVAHESDKLAGTHRECISMIDATPVLHEFACCVAEAALLIAEVTDQRCWNAIKAKRAWLRGDIDDAQLAAARDAALVAARDAWDAARDAAVVAARAAWAEQNNLLESMLTAAMVPA
jgi:hypothetical protein